MNNDVVQVDGAKLYELSRNVDINVSDKVEQIQQTLEYKTYLSVNSFCVVLRSIEPAISKTRQEMLSLAGSAHSTANRLSEQIKQCAKLYSTTEDEITDNLRRLMERV